MDKDNTMDRSPSGYAKPGESYGGPAMAGAQGGMVWDPLTDEDMARDWVCVVRFGIVLGEPGETPAAGASPARQAAPPVRRPAYYGNVKPGE
jgi:hypothetical protein